MTVLSILWLPVCMHGTYDFLLMLSAVIPAGWKAVAVTATHLMIPCLCIYVVIKFLSLYNEWKTMIGNPPDDTIAPLLGEKEDSSGDFTQAVLFEDQEDFHDWKEDDKKKQSTESEPNNIKMSS